MAYDGDVGIRSEFEMDGGQVWRFHAKPVDDASATALAVVGRNISYINSLIMNLVTAAHLQNKLPTAQHPMCALVKNPDHGDMELTFWLETLRH